MQRGLNPGVRMRDGRGVNVFMRGSQDGFRISAYPRILAAFVNDPLGRTRFGPLASLCEKLLFLAHIHQRAQGGYETWRARSSYLAVDAEEHIRSTALELLRRVAN